MAKDAKTRAKAKAAYEAGESLRAISSDLGVNFQTVQHWSKKEGWVKGKSQSKLEQRESAALEAEAERHGITKARVLAKLGELIDAQSVAVITTQGAVSLCPMPAGSKVTRGKADFMGIQYDVVPDRKSQIEVTKIAADVLGMKKLDITSGGRSLLDEVLDEG